jgi:hypothetical protein
MKATCRAVTSINVSRPIGFELRQLGFFRRSGKPFRGSTAHSKTHIGLFGMARLYVVGLAISFVVFVGALTFLAFNL